MQIRGLKPRGSYRSVCVLPRPNGESVALSMQPLPLGFQRMLADHGIVPPCPPTRIARDSAGRPMRDDTGAAITVADDQDADDRQAVELYHQRVAVLAVAESLAGDPNVEFGIERPQGPGRWDLYADALYVGMEEAGLTAGDLVHLCGFACRLSNLSGEHLREAGANFSSAASVPTG